MTEMDDYIIIEGTTESPGCFSLVLTHSHGPIKKDFPVESPGWRILVLLIQHYATAPKHLPTHFTYGTLEYKICRELLINSQIA